MDVLEEAAEEITDVLVGLHVNNGLALAILGFVVSSLIDAAPGEENQRRLATSFCDTLMAGLERGPLPN